MHGFICHSCIRACFSPFVISLAGCTEHYWTIARSDVAATDGAGSNEIWTHHSVSYRQEIITHNYVVYAHAPFYNHDVYSTLLCSVCTLGTVCHGLVICSRVWRSMQSPRPGSVMTMPQVTHSGRLATLHTGTCPGPSCIIGCEYLRHRCSYLEFNIHVCTVHVITLHVHVCI